MVEATIQAMPRVTAAATIAAAILRSSTMALRMSNAAALAAAAKAIANANKPRQVKRIALEKPGTDGMLLVRRTYFAGAAGVTELSTSLPAG